MVLTTDKNSKWHRKLWFDSRFYIFGIKGCNNCKLLSEN